MERDKDKEVIEKNKTKSRVNARHLALEPLCCLSSCRIRRAARALAFFEVSCAIVCVCLIVFPLVLYKTKPIFSPLLQNRFFDLGDNDIVLYSYIVYQFVWVMFNFLLLFALYRFDNRLLIIYAISQTVAFLFTLSALAASILELTYLIQIFHVALLILCILLTLLRLWSFFVIYECYKFFKLCQFLVTLGHSKNVNATIKGTQSGGKRDDQNRIVLDLVAEDPKLKEVLENKALEIEQQLAVGTSVTCADGSVVAALTVIVTIICLIGCAVVFFMRLFGYFFYSFPQALSLIVAVLCAVDFVILKFFTKTVEQELQEKATANKSAENSVFFHPSSPNSKFCENRRRGDNMSAPSPSLSEFITIQNLNILSRIQARFATTWISSRIKNAAKQATEVIFIAQIPDEAFISNFSMQIDDKLIYGNVKENEEARQTFEAAKSRGESAGLVAKKPRESNIFQISVNVAAESKVTFNLTYQEILQRVHGVYKHVVDAQTNYPVNSVNIEIEIHERGEITDLKVPRFEEKISEKTNKELLTYASEKDAIIERSSNGSESSVIVKFSPQTKNQIFAGQLAVLYDVKRDAGGSIEIVDGYFVHFFAPEGLPKGNKKIVFVLDRSGSMLGRKFEQLQQSMKVMLNDLDPGDTFNIIFFSTDSTLWKPESLRATPENVKAAQTYVADNSATTDIFGSLKLALKTLDDSTKKSDTLASMILFLTDGQPTEGVIDGNVITKNITDLNGGKYLIHCIGFGEDADMLLMQKISSKNRGLAKKVFEDSDAALQLTGFFDEISNPLLSQVKIKYLNDTVDVGSVVQNDDSSDYFDGGEVITIGKIYVCFLDVPAPKPSVGLLSEALPHFRR
uniref:Uncharacterized protein n=1 Tax=Romanomermis culicivorax TaxID=13658 RepID=A0A915K1V8_ROMCU